MPKVLVCYKWVLDESDIRINTDLSVDYSRAKYKISDYDKHTIESGSVAAKELGGVCVGISCGGAETRKSFNDALARGMDEGVWINTAEDGKPDGNLTATLLAAAASKTEDAVLLLCSEGSSDDYARQTGPRIAAILDWPVISSVTSYSMEGDAVIAKRKLEDVVQTVSVKLPAVVCVLPEVAPAPIPGLKQVMAARKKPVLELTPETLGVRMNTNLEDLGSTGYVSSRKNILINEDTKEQSAAALASALRKEGVI